MSQTNPMAMLLFFSTGEIKIVMEVPHKFGTRELKFQIFSPLLLGVPLSQLSFELNHITCFVSFPRNFVFFS